MQHTIRELRCIFHGSLRSTDFVSDELYSEGWIPIFKIVDNFIHESIDPPLELKGSRLRGRGRFGKDRAAVRRAPNDSRNRQMVLANTHITEDAVALMWPRELTRLWKTVG